MSGARDFVPGPWRADRRAILGKGGNVFAEVFSGGCDSLARADATERLIAAAPELYEALSLIVEECHKGYDLLPNRLLVKAAEALARTRPSRTARL